MKFIRGLVDTILKKLSLVRKREAELAVAAALTGAEEELKMKVEAALATEKRQLEWERQELDVNWVELKAYAHATGVPLLEERPFH